MPYLSGQVISDDELQGKLKTYRAQNAGAPNDDQSIINYWETGQKNWGDAQPQTASWATSQPANGGVAQQVQDQATANSTQNKERNDTLWNFMQEQMNQGTNVSANDPIIRARTDAYRAEQERSRRDYLADAAEKGGAYANLRGEERMTAESLGQNVGSFQAEAMSMELQSKRQQIAQALEGARGMLSDDQQMAVQQQLALLDQLIKEQGLNIQSRGQELDYDAILRRLGLDEWVASNDDYYRRAGL